MLTADVEQMKAAGVRVNIGDLRCLLAGHLARLTIQALRPSWEARSVDLQLVEARTELARLTVQVQPAGLIADMCVKLAVSTKKQGETVRDTPV
jgi:hypothetical protein